MPGDEPKQSAHAGLRAPGSHHHHLVVLLLLCAFAASTHGGRELGSQLARKARGATIGGPACIHPVCHSRKESAAEL